MAVSGWGMKVHAEWSALETCGKMLLKDVRHVPEVRLNLISTGRLDDEGYTGSIRNGAMKFSKGSLIVPRARKVNTLCLMNARLCPEEVNVASDTTGELWHKRLCHMSVKGMKRLPHSSKGRTP